MRKTTRMENSFSQSLLSQTIKKKMCLTNKNRKNKNGSIKKFFSESSHNVKGKSGSINVSDNESLNRLGVDQKSCNRPTENEDGSFCFDDADNDDSFDLFVPSKFTKLYPAKRSCTLSEEDNSNECKSEDRLQKSSSYFNDVTSHYSKTEILKQCPICFSQFSNMQLHLNSCMKKYCLSPEMVSMARTLREKFDSERNKLGLPLLSSTKIDLEKMSNNGFYDPVSLDKTSMSVKESCSSGNYKKPAELKWFGKSKKVSGNPLLFRRTHQEREQIITEKVAIVLMDSGPKDEFPKAQIILKSEHLMNQWNEDLILWGKSAKHSSSVETSEFYVPQLSSHIGPVKVRPKIQDENQTPSDLERIRDDCFITRAETRLVDENSETPDLSQCIFHSEPDKSDSGSKITESFEDSFIPCNKIINSFEEQEEGILCYDDTMKENKQSLEMFTSSCGLKSNDCSEQLVNSRKYKKSMSENNSCKCNFGSIQKKMEEQEDERHLKSLSHDWGRVFGKAEFSDITVLLSEGSTMPVHSIVLSARCHNILSDVVDDTESKAIHKLLKWSDISFDACFAFFKYIYTANIGHLDKLSADDIAYVRKLSTSYEVSGLNDILNSLMDVDVNYSSSGYSSVSALSSDNIKYPMKEISSKNADDFSQNNIVTEGFKAENASNSYSDTLVHDYSEHCENIHHKQNESSLSVKSDVKRKHYETTSSNENLDDSFKTKRSKLIYSESEIKGDNENDSIKMRRNSEVDMFTVDSDNSSHEGDLNEVNNISGTVDHKNVLIDTVIQNAFDKPFDSLDRSDNNHVIHNNKKLVIQSSNKDGVSDANKNDDLAQYDGIEVDLPNGFDFIGNYSTFSLQEGISSSPNVCLESNSALLRSSPLNEYQKNTTTDNNKTICKKSPKTSLDKYFVDDSFPSVSNVLDEIEVGSPKIPEVNCNENGSQSPISQMSPNVRMITVGSTPSPQVIRSDKVTPLPNYSTMISPELKNELRRYGLKPGLDRRKAKLLLRYIYDQIHPIVSELNSYSPRPSELVLSPSEKIHQVPVREIYLPEDNSDTESCKSIVSISSCAQSEAKDQD